MYWIDVRLENGTTIPQTILIPKGTVFEVQDPNTRAQCLVVMRDTPVTIPPGVHTVKVPGYCMNRDLSAPSLTPGQLTNFRMVAPFGSQEDVWNIVDDEP